MRRIAKDHLVINKSSMPTQHRRAIRTFIVLLFVGCLLGSTPTSDYAAEARAAQATVQPASVRMLQALQASYRVQITLVQPNSLEQITSMNALILSHDLSSALVLATGEQLEQLAKHHFEPRQIVDVAELLVGVSSLSSAASAQEELAQASAVDIDNDGLTDLEGVTV